MQRTRLPGLPARLTALLAAGFGLSGASGAAEAPPAGAVVAESEVNDVAQLPPPGPHRLIIGGDYRASVVRVIDGEVAESM
jgi:hypothetical protein